MYALTERELLMTETLPTANEAGGFFGTMRHHADPAEAWALALPAVAAATDATTDAARDFLDSRHGRHFADDVANGLFAGLQLAAAIDVAVARWMSWTITHRNSREAGIPAGLPYLTGLVIHQEIMAEMAA